MRAALEFATKLTESPDKIVEADRQGLRDAGWSDRDIWDIAATISFFNMSNRMAAAIEMLHAYSLIHDDLPCMDNDVLRRGKPTVHVRFGQAQAMLAGDAMQGLAFEVLTPQDEAEVPLPLQARLCGLLARAAGHAGMAGGQAIDLAAVGRTLNEAELRHMHRCKTGALLHGSVMMGERRRH